MTGLEGELSAQAGPVAGPVPSAAKVVSRPDVVSAAVTARSQGSKVEVESMRTETATTWANPDGTMTTEAHMAPVRFRNASGQWRSVDLELAKGTDGTVAPKGHKLGLRLGKRTAGTGGVFASAASANGGLMEWLAPFRLPEPSINGTKATYAEVQPGVNLALDARRTGFEADFVVKTRPESAPVWRFPLRTKGLTARTAKPGGIEFVDAKNVVRSRIPVAYMWDAATNPVTGEPVSKTVVDVAVEQVSPGKATLVVSPDAEWFMNPAREFPVTVDPTYVAGTASPSFDTFVQTSVGTDLSSTTDLRVGKNGTHQERTFFNFGTGPFQGKDIVSATLSLYQDGAMTCTPTAVSLYGAGVASTSPTSPTTWTNQPTISATASGTASFAKGFSSSCAAGRVGIPMTSLAQYWSTTQAGTVGVALKAASESDVSYWKRFRSMESATDPFVSFTWNRPPKAPATVQPTEAVSYAAPGESVSALYSAGQRPWVTTKATDPDGNTVKYIFEFYTGSGETFSLKGTCTSSAYASGTTAGCRPANNLPDNTLLYIRAKANDGRRDGPWTSYNTRLRIAAATPAAPSVSCPTPFDVNNTWHDTAPAADVVCTVTAVGSGFNAPGYLRLIVDGKRPPTNFTGGAAGQIKIVPSDDPAVAKETVTIPKGTPGLHTIVAQAESPAGRFSSTATQRLGWGGTALTSPTADPRVTTTGVIRIAASGPPKGVASAVTAKVRWRVAGYGGSQDTVGWNEDAIELPVVDNGAAGVTVDALWDTMRAETDVNLDADPSTGVVEPTALNPRVPVKLDLQVCFTYGTTPQCTWSQTPDTTIQRVPHAFGAGFPTADTAVGTVALWTGEFSTTATDADVPGYAGNLTVSRSHSTYAGPPTVMNSVFGPGWVAQFDGSDEGGAAGLEVVDSTLLDGTIALLAGDGTGLIFQAPNGQRRTTAEFSAGSWIAAEEDTALDGGKLVVTGSGTATRLTHTSADGVVTTFSIAAAPSTATAATFRPTGVSEPGTASGTAYSYDASGRVTRILAEAPPGVTCPATGPLNPGCRALRFTYATVNGAQVRLSETWLDIYNPAKTGGAAMDSIKIAAYTYDEAARLAKVTDPRSNLSTEYDYNAAHLLTSVKPAGQIPFQLNYVTVNQQAKLDMVKRDRPAGDPTGGTATLAKIVYDLPLSGTGLPDLTATSVNRWGQRSMPVRGYAVFGPDHPLNGAPGEADWRYADLLYADAAGYTVNSAGFGVGGWQYTSTDYDDTGNIIRELDQRALRKVIDEQLPAGMADQLSTQTKYNEDINDAAGQVVTPAGTLPTDTYGPAKFAALKDGTVRWLRSHTHTAYDQLAPNNGINPATGLPYRLETSEVGTAQDPGTGEDVERIAGSVTGYAPAFSGDVDGWALGLETRSSTDIDLDGTLSAGDQTYITRYDAEGRSVEVRQAKSASGTGNDAGTTKTVYYSSAANAAFPQCGQKPEWAGLVCRTSPGGAPTSAAGEPTTPTMPTTSITGYTYLLAPAEVSETSGAATRTTTTTFLPDGRIKGATTAVAGLASSTPTTHKETTYDSATGAATVATALNGDGSTAGTVTTGYDTWGRPISYQASGDTVSTTRYNAAGDVSEITDGNGTTTYTYDGPDALGQQETRGLVTKVDVNTAGGTWTSTAAYDVDGDMILQKLPGGVSEITNVDNTGEMIGLEYRGPTSVINDDGSTTVDPDGKWLAWSRDNDVNGRLAREWTPDGAAFTGSATDVGPTDVGDALPYDRAYSYDAGGRLIQVQDRTGAPGVDILDPSQTACVTRTYGFDANDNRVSKATATSDETGSCTTGQPTTLTRAFDTADRPTTGANGQGNYAYDALGRSLAIPAADAPRPQDGDVTITYYDNDAAQSITQGAKTTAFTLDAFDRRITETETTAGVATQLTRHYTDSSDSPTWITQGATTHRYTELIGDLALTVAQDGTGRLTLSNPHGDIVTTVDLSSSTSTASGIAGWSNFDEYGIASTANTATTGPIQYGWHGAQQRATSGAGLQLMGARLYNSATGLFTSVDPIADGNSNDYVYPTDPVNQSDLDGRARCMCGGVGSRGGIGGGTSRSSGLRGRAGRSAGTGPPARSGGHRYGLKHLNRVMDRLEKSARGKAAAKKGKKGMELANVKQQAYQKIKVRIDGKWRNFKPDFWSKSGRTKVIGEVKHFEVGKTLSATRQIRGMAKWAKQNGYKFVIRVNHGVKLSRTLRQMARDGDVKISRY
ncbi:DNRLRE domain-containing protein [Kribbella yunnanensis]|uniref:DNRLRE domain-containing protein n=1 Tax=Kribbella yunnanensis TaxID=190194 RepID=UPI0031D4DDEA